MSNLSEHPQIKAFIESFKKHAAEHGKDAAIKLLKHYMIELRQDPNLKEQDGFVETCDLMLVTIDRLANEDHKIPSN